MPTLTLDAISKAYPSITNRIRASITLSNDTAVIASIIDTTSGHPSRVWHFPGLPRANYAFSLDEIDGGGAPINNLALFDVVPGQIDGVLVRNDEQIKADTTPGFNSGVQTWTFDGRETSPGSGIFVPNYIGWEIVPSELTGRGILVRGLDYSWDKTTGIFTLLQSGDLLPTNQWYNIHFEPVQNPSGGSVPTIKDFSTRIVTDNDSITLDDFGNNIVAEPAGNYIELTLPLITTVAPGRILYIEIIKVLGADMNCVKIIPQSGDAINWLRGNIFMMNNESLEIYRLKRPDDSNEWRIKSPDGNFKTVGELVPDDQVATDVYCKLLLDGSIINKFKFARLYEELVLNLPPTQVCDFDDWVADGPTRYLYSFANSADPDNLDKFHIPDRRGIFERNNSTGKAGDYSDDTMKDHYHLNGIADDFNNRIWVYGAENTDMPGAATNTVKDEALPRNYQGKTSMMKGVTGGSEIKPKNYLINKYVLV